MVGWIPRVRRYILLVKSWLSVLSLPCGKLNTGMFKAIVDDDCSGITPEDSSYSTYYKGCLIVYMYFPLFLLISLKTTERASDKWKGLVILKWISMDFLIYCQPLGQTDSFFLFLIKMFFNEDHFKIFIYLFLAVLGLCCCTGFSPVVTSGGYSLLQCSGFSLWWLLWWQSMGSRACGV